MRFEIKKSKTTIAFKVDENKVDNQGELFIRYQINGKENTNSDDRFYSAKGISCKDCAIVFYKEQVIEGRKVLGVRIEQEKMNQLVELQRQLQIEAKAEKEEEERKVREGEVKIEAWYHDGEYLSGYQVSGYAAELLKKVGAAREVSFWGTYVDSELIKALGEQFTYQQVLEYIKPETEKKEAERQAKFDKAKRTGKPVMLYKYTVDCNDTNEACDTDIIAVCAMPNGTIKKTRTHTY